MTITRFLILLGVVTMGVHTTPGQAQVEAHNDVSTQCKALESIDFSTIVDAPTQITQAKPIQARSDLPAYCLVKGYVSPNVGIKLALPSNWNGKFIELGCGGHCGVLPEDEQFPLWYSTELHKGYACIVSDMGHQGALLDGLWAYENLQAKVDFGFRATHVVALAGKALVERYYHSPPQRAYFLGGSTGGRQGLQEAQRFPWDFDGIVAIAPPLDLSALYLTFGWEIRALHDQDGKPVLGKEELELLTNSAVAKCDLDDGVKDGVIGDPLHCAFDPMELTCKGQQTTGCLTAAQVEAVKKVYSGPLNSKGEKLSLGGPLVGSELGQWDRMAGLGWFGYLGFDGQHLEKHVTGSFQYLLFWPDPGPMWKLIDFDFDRDSRRMGTMQAIYDASNPDLRAFKAKGGKLLVFHGLNDAMVVPRQTIDYYETVEHTMGGRTATQSFFRLFLLSGAGHVPGGEGADTVDYLSALEAWVEENQAPDRLIAAHLKESARMQPLSFPLDPAAIQFTRPVYPYPIRAQYKGRGDSNDAANFGPAGH